MSKKAKDQKSGYDKFYEHYKSVYSDRWIELIEALKHSEFQFNRKNKFSKEQLNQDEEKGVCRDSSGLLQNYIMDPGSIYAAELLQVEWGNKVLDMCAAPGGKSLILAEKLFLSLDKNNSLVSDPAIAISAELILNELSETRRERLKKVIQQYIPRHFRDQIFVKGKDAGKYALSHKEYFDRILLDAPCSGERHLLENQKELQEWTPSRSQKLAQRQYALLTAGLIALRNQGKMIYSTCSISEYENDLVIERLIHKKGDQFVVDVILDHELESVCRLYGHEDIRPERTKYGLIFLPDKTRAGPIYICRLIKN